MSPQDRRLRRIGWCVSLALHGLLAVGAAHWLAHPPEAAVRSGLSSVEVQLVASPEPAPAPPAETLPPDATPDPEPEPLPETAPTSQPVAKAEPAPETTRRAEAAAASQGTLSAQPDYLHNPAPEYPPASRRAREEGTVYLSVEIDERGSPVRVTVSRSSGYPRLDAAALRTVSRWRFSPARLGGVAVACNAVVPVRFELKD
ncbi:MAG: energy transducer TonB [Verrucomicrobium sp.]|nr:energy transducer TonB [Verrucomicrobium sp.]